MTVLLLRFAYGLAGLALALVTLVAIGAVVLYRQDRHNARARLALLQRPDVREGSPHA